MKTTAWLITAILLLSSFGCQKPASPDVEEFISTHTKIVDEIVRVVTAEPSAQGVDKAQKYFDENRADLKAKLDKMDSVKASDVNEDQMKKFQTQLWKDNERLFAPVKDLASQPNWDQAATEKYNRLIADVRSRTPSEKDGK
ncbi:hypothetical protein BH10ACI2_BH10ACI2_02960 [soil metagenome]